MYMLLSLILRICSKYTSYHPNLSSINLLIYLNFSIQISKSQYMCNLLTGKINHITKILLLFTGEKERKKY